MDPEAEACQLIPLKNQEFFSSHSLIIHIDKLRLCILKFRFIEITRIM